MKIATVARWKPLHLGHAAMLEALLARADELLVGIGSANRYGPKNPFTLAETEGMLRAFLGARARACRWTLVPVPDLDDGPRWRVMVAQLFGRLDLFVSANEYVRGLLVDTWPLAHPRDLVPRERHVPIDGARVRRALARGEPWEGLVPPETAEFLRARGLPERFRREFGLATLALDALPA